MNRVIINADDFGLDESCTKAIKEAFDKNLISSTTMVANGDAYELAVEIARNHLQGKVGIHFNLGDGKPLTKDMESCSIFVENGNFNCKLKNKRFLTKSEKLIVYNELVAQVERIQKDGIEITHADSHHNIHNRCSLLPIIVKVCREHGINKIRLHRNLGKISFLKKIYKKLFNIRLKIKGFITTKYFGSIEDANFKGIKDYTEIMVHPDYNENCEIIDKIYVDDLPTGQPLENLKEKFGCILVSYKDI